MHINRTALQIGPSHRLLLIHHIDWMVCNAPQELTEKLDDVKMQLAQMQEMLRAALPKISESSKVKSWKSTRCVSWCAIPGSQSYFGAYRIAQGAVLICNSHISVSMLNLSHNPCTLPRIPALKFMTTLCCPIKGCHPCRVCHNSAPFQLWTWMIELDDFVKPVHHDELMKAKFDIFACTYSFFCDGAQ